MPGKNGIQVARQLHEAESQVRILVLSAYDNGPHIRGMFEAGVSGYLTKDEVPEVLVQAIRGIMRGSNRWVSESVAAKIFFDD
jgi:DNA-binding NarL/FixJ family response regulator